MYVGVYSVTVVTLVVDGILFFESNHTSLAGSPHSNNFRFPP